MSRPGERVRLRGAGGAGPGRVARWAAVAVVAGLLATACTSSGDGVPDGGPQVSEKPLWDQRTLGLEEASAVEFVGDTAVVTGNTHLGPSRLLVVNASDGTPRWLLSQDDALRGGEGIVADESAFVDRPTILGDPDGDWSILVQYRLTAEAAGKDDEDGLRDDDHVEGGLAALSGKDGRVLWKTPLLRSGPAEKGEDGEGDSDPASSPVDDKSHLVASDGRYALVTSLPPQRTQLVDRVRTFAVDLSNGRKVWETTGRWAYQIAGDTVLTMEANSEGTPPWEEWDNGEIAAVDLKTGKQRWKLASKYQEAHLEAAAGKTVVVQAKTEDDLSGRTYLLDATTGAERGAVDERFLNCFPDEQKLIACVDASDPELTLIDARTGELGTESEKVLDDAENTLTVDSVQSEGVFVSAPRDEDEDSQVEAVMLDRSGDRIAEKLPGSTMAYNGEYAAFAVPRKGDPSEMDDLMVYRVGQGSQPEGPPVRDKPTAEPVNYDTEPLWSGTTSADLRPDDRDLRLAAVSGVRIVGDAFVYTGPEPRDHDQTLTVADPETGKVRWSLTDNDPLGDGDTLRLNGTIRPTGAPGKEQLLVSYYSGRRLSGVAALSLKDGEVSWKLPDPVDNPETHFALLSETDPRHFLMGISPYGPDDGEDTAAFDPTNRRELWRAEDFDAQAIAGDLVLGIRNGAVAALDLKTGDQRWSLAKSHPEAELLLGRESGDTTVVALPDGAAALDTATGKELGRTPFQITGCEGAGEPLVVCQTSGGSATRASFAVNVTVDKGKATFTPLLETTPLGDYRGLDGRMFATRQNFTETEPRAKPSYLELDAAGRQLTDELPGRPMEVTEDYIVFYTGDIEMSAARDLRFTVHERR